MCLVLDNNNKMNSFPVLQPTGFTPTHATATVPTVAVKPRTGVIPPTTEVPAFFNHPIMQKFGTLDHTNFETTMTWITPATVPFMHLGLDAKEEKWGLFARDEMAVLVGAALFLTTKEASINLFKKLKIFNDSKTKQEFFAYAMGHAAALLHGGFTAIMFSRWADKMFVHPDDPTIPVEKRVQQSLENSKPVRFVNKTITRLQHTFNRQKYLKPTSAIQYKQDTQPTIIAKPRSGTANSSLATQTSTFVETMQKHFNENLGLDTWAKAQKLCNYFIAVPILPALRWHNYITKEQEQKLGKEEAHRKRTELAVRDASTMFGGNLLYLTTWVVGLSVLEHKLPQLSLNYRQNVASVFSDLAKNLNAGIFAVLLSKWVTAKKTSATVPHTTVSPHQYNQHLDEVSGSKPHHTHEITGINTKSKRHFHA